MKRLKKQFTLLMVLAMLATSIVLPMSGAVSATDVSAVSESDSVFIDENFNGYVTRGDAMANGWKPVGEKSESFDLGEVDAAHQNSMKLTRSGTNVDAKYYAESLTTGKFRYTYSLYLKPTSTDSFLVDTTATESAVAGINLLFISAGKVYVKDASAANKLLISSPSEGWYTFESIVDLDNTTHEVTAYSADGAQVGHMKLDELGIRTGGLNDQGVSGIMFRQWADTTTYVDDVKMEYYTVDPVLMDENFNDYASSEEAIANGWALGSNGVSFDLEQVDTAHQNSMKLTKTDKDVQAKYYAESLTTGKFKYTYSLYLKPTSSNMFLVDTTATANAVAGINLLFFSNGSVKVKDANTKDQLLISLPPEGWYTFESIVDLDNTTHEVTPYNANGAQVGPMKLDELGIRTGGVNNQGVSGIMFRQWEAGGTIYVDDIKMEYCVETPQILDNSVAFIDADGSEATALQNVPASTKKISIDFGCEVVGSSVEGNITVTDGSDSVPYTYTVEDTKVVLTLSSFMKPNTDYTLKIGKGISSSDNIALGTDYDIRFTTGEAVKSAGIGSVKIDDAEFTALTQLYNGAVLKVSTDYVNTTEDNMSFVWIVAYYDANDRLLSIQIQEANSVAGGESIPVKEFTVGDIDGIAEVDVYLWNSVIGMIPYGDRYAVDKNGIVE